MSDCDNLFTVYDMDKLREALKQDNEKKNNDQKNNNGNHKSNSNPKK